MRRPLRLSCADHCFGPIGHAERFMRARRLGFEAIDVVVVGGYTWLQPDHVRADVAGAATAVRSEADRAGLAIADVMAFTSFDYSALALTSLDPDVRAEAREWFTDMLAFAVATGSPGLTVLPGVCDAGRPLSEALDQAAAELSWRVTAAANEGIELSVEPHVGSLIERPEHVQWLLDHTPGLRLTLDHTHFVAQGDPQHSIDPLIGAARHIQTRGAHLGQTHSTLATSTMDFAALLAALDAHAYAGYVSIEYGWTSDDHPHHLDAEAEAEELRKRLSRLATG